MLVYYYIFPLNMFQLYKILIAFELSLKYTINLDFFLHLFCGLNLHQIVAPSLAILIFAEEIFNWPKFITAISKPKHGIPCVSSSADGDGSLARAMLSQERSSQLMVLLEIFKEQCDISVMHENINLIYVIRNLMYEIMILYKPKTISQS